MKSNENLEQKCKYHKSPDITKKHGVLYTACHKLCNGYDNKSCEFYKPRGMKK